jgi:hypothetical protein
LTHAPDEKISSKPDIEQGTSPTLVAMIESTLYSNQDHDGTGSSDNGNEDCNNDNRGNEDTINEDNSNGDHNSNDSHQYDSDTASHPDFTNPHTPFDITPDSIFKNWTFFTIVDNSKVGIEESHSFKSNDGLFSNNIEIPTIFGFYHIYVRIKASITSLLSTLIPRSFLSPYLNPSSYNPLIYPIFLFSPVAFFLFYFFVYLTFIPYLVHHFHRLL